MYSVEERLFDRIYICLNLFEWIECQESEAGNCFYRGSKTPKVLKI